VAVNTGLTVYQNQRKTEETFYIFLILFNRSSFGNPVKKTAGINSEKEERLIVSNNSNIK